MGLDIRYTEKHNPEELLKKIKSIYNDSAEIKTVNVSKFLYSPSDHNHIKKYHRVMETELGEKITIEGEHSGSDAAHFMHLGVPIILHRANGGDVHSEKEWASISSFEKMMLGLERFLKDFN
jgi:acetylornithine deacetylase/succinyl-diaminopimelate desuccinylase-like protein